MAATHRLVGREHQVEILEELLDGLADARGGVLFLTGEPGIGKSRLAEEAVARATSRGARTAWATAWQDAGAPPLWLWSELLRQLTGSAAILEQPAVERPDAADDARFRQFEAVADALRRAADAAPVVAVLDDLQWADVASLRMLAFVAPALRAHACLLVGTYRVNELEGDDLATLVRLGPTLALPGLDGDAVRQVLAMSAGGPVPDHVAHVIRDRSGGNPLFVWEFGHLMASVGRTDMTPAAVPPAVAAVIGRRLARLSEGVVSCLQAAAVAGKEFSAAFVEALDGAGADAPRGALADEAAGLLVRTDRAEAELAFAHDLVRQVVLDAIPASRRIALHKRAAELHRDRLGRDPAAHAVVAAHLEHAGEEHREEAGHQWEAAARRALEMLSYEEAAARFGDALRLSPPDSPRRADLLLAQADALLRAGELAEARVRFEEAADAARRAGQADRLAAAALGIGAGVAGWEVPMWDRRHVDLVEEALHGVGDHELGLRSMLLARLSVAAATPDSLDASRHVAEEAVALARQVDDPALVAQALAALCDALAAPEHAAVRRAHAETIVALAESAGDRALALLGRRFRVVALLELGDFRALDAEIELFDRHAALLRHPLLGWYTDVFRGMRALLRGDVDEAARRHDAVVVAAERTGSKNASLLAATLGVGIDMALGRVGLVEAYEALVADVDPLVWASAAAGVAFIALRAGDEAKAASLLRLHAEHAFTRVGHDAEHLVTLTMFGRVAVALDDRGAAEELYRRLLPFAGLWVVDGIAALCWGPVDLELARLGAALGRRGEAAAHLAAARAAVTRAGAALLDREVDEVAAAIDGTAGADRPEERAPDAVERACVFRREGQLWTLAFDGRVVRVKDAKGLGDISRLLAEPGREMHVADLYGDRSGGAPAPAGDLGEVLDRRARAAYRDRLAELEEEIADADGAHDRGRAEKARAERDFLTAELSAALGLGGRPRRFGGANERARKAVTARIRLAVDRLAEPHPGLARHLRNSIRTGLFCSYQPEQPIDWQQ